MEIQKRLLRIVCTIEMYRHIVSNQSLIHKSLCILFEMGSAGAHKRPIHCNTNQLIQVRWKNCMHWVAHYFRLHGIPRSIEWLLTKEISYYSLSWRIALMNVSLSINNKIEIWYKKHGLFSRMIRSFRHVCYVATMLWVNSSNLIRNA